MGEISVAAPYQHKDGRSAGGQLVMPGIDRSLLEMLKPAGEGKKERLSIWNSIQNDKTAAAPPPPPYVHPLVRRSSSLMSQKSLEICTESLGSENGSDGFSSGDEMDSYFSSSSSSSSSSSKGETEDEEEETEGEEAEEAEEEIAVERPEKKELPTVNYHCSIGRRSPVRSFPPPLPSISRRDGPCIKMKPHRRDGRLVVEAVAVPSHNYLHAERHGGRLLLSFISTSSRSNPPAPAAFELQQQQEEDVEEEMVLQAEEEEEIVEEEVEVVDRGTIVEVKVSAQPQVSGMAAVKVRRSSLVINKFVVGSPLAAGEEPSEIPNNGSSPLSLQDPIPNSSPPAAAASAKRASLATTTAAAAAVAASSISTSASTTEGFHYNYLQHQKNSRWGTQSPAAAAAADAKLLFTSKRLSREELLHDMRRCSELRRPLFIFEQPHCIATSS